MGFRLTVKGKDTDTFGEKMISIANVDVNTPVSSMAKSSSVAITLYVSGKLFSPDGDFSDSDTLKLFEWSLVEAKSADAYREVTVEVITAGQTFRTIKLPNAFVVDYSERYTDDTGVGIFSMIIRQRTDQISQVKPGNGQQAEN